MVIDRNHHNIVIVNFFAVLLSGASLSSHFIVNAKNTKMLNFICSFKSFNLRVLTFISSSGLLLSSLVTGSSENSMNNSLIEPSQTTANSVAITEVSPPTTPAPSIVQSCNKIDWVTVPEGVSQARDWLSERELERDNCAILTMGQIHNIASEINQLPENTTIFFSSDLSPESTTSALMGMTPASSSMESTHSVKPTSALAESTTFDLQITPTLSSQFISPSLSTTLQAYSAPSPVAPAPALPQKRIYYISKPIKIKNGQHFLSAADDGFEIILKEADDFIGSHMMEMGSKDDFLQDEVETSVIRKLTFETQDGDARKAVDSIIFAQCSNRELQVLDNHFILDARASVYMRCNLSYDNQPDGSGLDFDIDPVGPGLKFERNTIKGSAYQFAGHQYLPDEGLFIFLANINGLQNRLNIAKNIFMGAMIEGIEAHIGLNSNLLLTNNTIDISNKGLSRPDERRFVKRGGIVLRGSTGDHAQSELPLYALAGNCVAVTDKAITIQDQFQVGFSCNTLTASAPWRQDSSSLPIYSASDDDFSEYCDFRQKPASGSSPISVATSSIFAFEPVQTPDPLPYITTANTWTALTSEVMPCDGLMNLIGQIQFESTDCSNIQPAMPATKTDTAKSVTTSGTEFEDDNTGLTTNSAITGTIPTLHILILGATAVYFSVNR